MGARSRARDADALRSYKGAAFPRCSYPPGRKTIVILVTHHSVADGMSLVFLLRDLLTAFSGQLLPPYPLPKSLDEIVSVPVHTLSDPGVTFSYDLAKKYVESPVHVRSSVLSPELTWKIQERARQQVCPSTAGWRRSFSTCISNNEIDLRQEEGFSDKRDQYGTIASSSRGAETIAFRKT
jgi:hypothetical protein